jgi:hypothetical protein
MTTMPSSSAGRQVRPEGPSAVPGELPAFVGAAGQARRVVVHEQDRPTLGDPVGHGGVERAARGLVEAGPRLVEHEQAGPGE